MIRLARLSIGHPIRALAAWGLIALALAAIGLGVSDRHSPSIVVVPATDSSRAQHLAEAEFGPSVRVPILLEGPARTLDRRGARRWSGGCGRSATSASCRRGTAATPARSSGPGRLPRWSSAAVARTEEEMVDGRQAEIEAMVDAATTEPVRAHVTGSRRSTSR